MKLLFFILITLLSLSINSQEITEAEKIFNSLNSYEYKYAAITELIICETIVRHDDKISCQKETTFYQKTDEVQISFKCNPL